jgi:hypothetical protein
LVTPTQFLVMPMTARFAGWLGCVGILGILALAFPGLVLVGFVAGFVPGVMLTAAPNLFLYSLPWWIVRELILRACERLGLAPNGKYAQRALYGVAALAALILVLAVGIAVPKTVNIRTDAEIAALRSDDRDVQRPIELPATVALVSRDFSDYRQQVFCSRLCQALLFNHAVSRVIVADTAVAKAVGAFLIEKRDQCDKLPAPMLDSALYVKQPYVKGMMFDDRIKARMAAGECVVRAPGMLAEAGVIFSWLDAKRGMSPFGKDWSLDLDTVSAKRLEVAEMNGTLLFRHTEIVAKPLTVPLGIITVAGFFTTVRYAGWARSNLTASDYWRGIELLPKLFGDAIRMPDFP